MSDLKDAIDRQNAIFEKHFAANDMESLKGLYTEDCRLMPQGADTMVGNNVIPQVMGGMISAGATSVSLVADEVGPLGASAVGIGDLVYERGHYKFSKADGSAVAAGKYVVIWKKTEEGFKLYIDIFNDN
ncbi:uncharacterized protein LOC110987909 [Acanthaster planci]|uniref:Uncharacterized protein LOC110987909 n=1 Tax=Acanthaster planci TaxID=133434 RepID=A0A8B7ZPD2_ACAPL|nr:uncharacterized protein LOC110987909 [Acanthaster planci]